MQSIFIVGADSHLGRDARAALSSDFEVVTDSTTFGLSEALQRGQLIDQMRRFGPFDVVLVCLEINVQRELNYAVDIIPDVLSKPWLVLSVLRELYSPLLDLDMVVATPESDSGYMWGTNAPEQDVAAAIVDTALKGFRTFAAVNAGLNLRECAGLESTLNFVRSLPRQA